MTIEIKVPALPESVADATVLTWHKKPGEQVVRDENLVDLETDKVVLEVPSPIDGILKEIKIPVGTKVLAGQLLGLVEAGAVEEKIPPNLPRNEYGAGSFSKGGIAEVDFSKERDSGGASSSSKRSAAKGEISEIYLSPSARRAAKEGNSGSDFSKEGGVIPPFEKEPAPYSLRGGLGGISSRQEERVPLSRLRQRIAERLLNAQHDAAILTTFNEINLKAVIDLRLRYKDQFEKTYQVKLGFMSFFTRAVVEALKRFPCVNASIEGTEMVYHHYYDIGVAVSTERGLVVPVLRDADKMSFADIENKIADVSRRARDNQITLEEITGGTFTITNGGIFGSLLSTPILNPPQSAILGMHKIEERPMVENGQIVIRPMMYLALSYDHRMIDGKDSVQFLVTVKELLEDPARLLLEI